MRTCSVWNGGESADVTINGNALVISTGGVQYSSRGTFGFEHADDIECMAKVMLEFVRIARTAKKSQQSGNGLPQQSANGGLPQPMVVGVSVRDVVKS